MDSLSFDGLVELYDKTRTFDKGCFDSALDYIAQYYPPKFFGHVLEPGVGTGRIAIPLARRGYKVTGIDISEKMLNVFAQRLDESGLRAQVTFRKADVLELPYTDGAFDMAVVVHLFYFIRDWHRAADEILRVVKADGPIILMHTGTGMEIPSLNDRYKQLCEERGAKIETIGVKSTREVINYYVNIGCDLEWVKDMWSWTYSIKIADALKYIESRAYVFTMTPPDEVHKEVVEQMRKELIEQHGSLDKEIEVSCRIYIAALSRR